MSLQGLIVATPTPFNSEGKIDFDYVNRHLDFMREKNVNGVVPSGTNGEGCSLSVDERKSLFRAVIANKGDLSVIPGTGCASLPETVELTRAAEEMGADAALVLPPFFFKSPSVEGLYDYYSTVLQSTSLPILLYNIPQYSGIEITDELVERLLHFPNLLGIKDSSCDLFRTLKYRAHFPHLKIFVGADIMIEPTANAGVAGILSGIANAFPELIAEAIRECAAGRGHEIQTKVNRVAEIFAAYPIFSANKYALMLRGFPPTGVRPPLVDLSDEQKRTFADALAREQLI